MGSETLVKMQTEKVNGGKCRDTLILSQLTDIYLQIGEIVYHLKALCPWEGVNYLKACSL